MTFDVSFIITIYNKKRDLPFALASLEAQEGSFSREYIIVDDGSTDGSGDIAAERTAAWPNVTLIRQRNMGMNKATQVGIDAAKGQFIKFLDADDVLAPFATAHLLAALEESSAPLAYGQSRIVADFETLRFARPARLIWQRQHRSLRQILKHNLCNPSMSMMRREALQACGGVDTRVFGCQDYSIGLRLAARFGDFVALPYPVMACLEDLTGRESLRLDKVFRESATITRLFFLDTPTLSWRLRNYAARRHALRYLKYARREQKVSRWHSAYWQGRLAYAQALVAPESALARIIALYPDYGYCPAVDVVASASTSRNGNALPQG